ncbi:predicted protein [Postia placenta Mad-698-R]|nr:predicted protein [Postia placenta Mad-698-R]
MQKEGGCERVLQAQHAERERDGVAAARGWNNSGLQEARGSSGALHLCTQTAMVPRSALESVRALEEAWSATRTVLVACLPQPHTNGKRGQGEERAYRVSRRRRWYTSQARRSHMWYYQRKAQYPTSSWLLMLAASALPERHKRWGGRENNGTVQVNVEGAMSTRGQYKGLQNVRMPNIPVHMQHGIEIRLKAWIRHASSVTGAKQEAKIIPRNLEEVTDRPDTQD